MGPCTRDSGNIWNYVGYVGGFFFHVMIFLKLIVTNKQLISRSHMGFGEGSAWVPHVFRMGSDRVLNGSA